jgi:hypothetical protein
MGVVDGSVSGELGVGTSMSGVEGGDSLGASVGLPGSLGPGSSSGRGVSDMIFSFTAYNRGGATKLLVSPCAETRLHRSRSLL